MPSEDVAIVALTNAAPSGVPETLTAQFVDLVQYGTGSRGLGSSVQEGIRADE